MSVEMRQDVLNRQFNFPDDIRVIEMLGQGGRAQVYKAKLKNEDVVVKIYDKDVAEKYLEKYSVDIAQFEFNRNKALFGINEIQEYVAKPYRAYPITDQYEHSIIQEYVPGTILETLINDLGYLPEEILKAGYTICLLYTSPSPRDLSTSRMPSSA